MFRVLIVDDTAVDRCLVEGLLRRHGVEYVETASNGAAALECLTQADGNFQVVVTDLNMPEIDGLELTSQIRLQFPWIPVVLITAHGSEEMALRALEQGAASYVPKSHLFAKLFDVVEQVARAATISRQSERFAQSMRRADLEFELQNDELLFIHLGEMVQQIIGAMGVCDARDEVRVMMAVEETLRRALYCGNLEFSEQQVQNIHAQQSPECLLVEERRSQSPFCHRRLHVRVQLSRTEARFVIRSESPAFDVSETRVTNGDAGILADESRWNVLIRSFMDEVVVSPDGKEVVLVKYGSPAVKPENELAQVK